MLNLFVNLFVWLLKLDFFLVIMRAYLSTKKQFYNFYIDAPIRINIFVSPLKICFVLLNIHEYLISERKKYD